MAKLSDRRCYYCGEPADGADEHAPPKVLFPNARLYWNDPSPPPDLRVAKDEDTKASVDTKFSISTKGDIIKVPSCVAHNLDDSAADERVRSCFAREPLGGAWAYLALDYTDKIIAPMVGSYEKQEPLRDEGFVFHPYVQAHDLPDLVSGQASKDWEPGRADWDAFERRVQADGDAFETVLRKTAAAIHYAVSGEPLGQERISTLKIASPWFTNSLKARFSTNDAADHKEFVGQHFDAGDASWKRVISGSTQVVYVEHLWKKAWKKRFGLLLRFFASQAEFWIVSP